MVWEDGAVARGREGTAGQQKAFACVFECGDCLICVCFCLQLLRFSVSEDCAILYRTLAAPCCSVVIRCRQNSARGSRVLLFGWSVFWPDLHAVSFRIKTGLVQLSESLDTALWGPRKDMAVHWVYSSTGCVGPFFRKALADSLGGSWKFHPSLKRHRSIHRPRMAAPSAAAPAAAAPSTPPPAKASCF